MGAKRKARNRGNRKILGSLAQKREGLVREEEGSGRGGREKGGETATAAVRRLQARKNGQYETRRKQHEPPLRSRE